jgi:hypothetical protein
MLEGGPKIYKEKGLSQAPGRASDRQLHQGAWTRGYKKTGRREVRGPAFSW